MDILHDKIINTKDFVNTNYIQTLILVVKREQILLLKENYILMSENIVPESLMQFNVKEDKEGNTLWSIKLVKICLGENSSKSPLEDFIKNMKEKIKYLCLILHFLYKKYYFISISYFNIIYIDFYY